MSEAAPLVVIDFPAAPRRVFTHPEAVLVAHSVADVSAVIREAQRAALRGCRVAGFIAYEAAPAFDAALQVRAGARMPLAWFGVFRGAGLVAPRAAVRESSVAWRLEADVASYRAKVARIRQEIARGRTYQVNLTERFTAPLDAEPFALYEALRRAQGEGYHAYIDSGQHVVLSVSPELFFEIRGRHIRTRPMKGTRPRGRWIEEDDALARELAASDKERAENLMIVDLLRSDVGRVAAIGSVQVTSLFAVERYRTVQQLTSTIEAELRPETDVGDVFAALFPCGSVTGAPKISTMQLITELEAAPREVYCGAVGVLEPSGDVTFNVAIRTVWVERATGRATYGSGGGITWSSVADEEYAELAVKAAVLTERWPQFELLETMRFEEGRVPRLERHLARLLASARYFGIPADEATLRGCVKGALSPGGGPRRLRLLVDQQGRARTELLPIEPFVPGPLVLARSPVSSADRFLYHKTTHREAYDRRLAEQPCASDVLLWNEREEITEFTRGNVVVEIDGRRWTPPRECGLLAGTLRAELLEAGDITERVISRQELEVASGVWFINSVRGWVRVR